jgi:hypothetical protein
MVWLARNHNRVSGLTKLRILHEAQRDMQTVALQVDNHVLAQQSVLNIRQAATSSTHIALAQEGTKGHQHGGEHHNLNRRTKVQYLHHLQQDEGGDGQLPPHLLSAPAQTYQRLLQTAPLTEVTRPAAVQEKTLQPLQVFFDSAVGHQTRQEGDIKRHHSLRRLHHIPSQPKNQQEPHPVDFVLRALGPSRLSQ